MSFTFKKTSKNCVPVAIVSGGKKDNAILYLDPDSKQGEKCIRLKDGEFIPLPNIHTRDIWYVAGPSGSGKSTVAGKIIEVYHEIFPKACIFLFSKLGEDDAYDKLEKGGVISRVVLDERIVEEPIEIKDEIDKKHGALMIFDDTDTIRDKKILEQVGFLKRDIGEIGRHNNIYCIQTSHLINGINKNEARVIHNELTKLVIFPESGGFKQQSYCLSEYWGLDKKTIKRILNLPSRWILMSKTYPQYILTQSMCCLLKEFEKDKF